MNGDWIVMRGGGDLATGVAQAFKRAGFPLLILETESPTAIRRTVSLSEAIYDGTAEVEDLRCRKVADWSEALALPRALIPILADPQAACLSQLRPSALIDAIIAKKNLGTRREMAACTIALGPGFSAGQDVDIVVETMRGHDLGRLIFNGSAAPNTGIPGLIGGQDSLRVIHAPVTGTVIHWHAIGDQVHKGERILSLGEQIVYSPLTGILRGLIREGLTVRQGMKIADVDPRLDVDCYSISDKARCLGGAALTAYLYLLNNQEPFSDGGKGAL